MLLFLCFQRIPLAHSHLLRLFDFLGISKKGKVLPHIPLKFSLHFRVRGDTATGKKKKIKKKCCEFHFHLYHDHLKRTLLQFLNLKSVF